MSRPPSGVPTGRPRTVRIGTFTIRIPRAWMRRPSGRVVGVDIVAPSSARRLVGVAPVRSDRVAREPVEIARQAGDLVVSESPAEPAVERDRRVPQAQERGLAGLGE